MRVAVLSDVHGNLPALEAVLGAPPEGGHGSVLRAFSPAGEEHTTPPHQERAFIGGRPDAWTAWIPLGDFDIGLDGKPENATSHPAPGQVLWYPGGLSETEILFPYGGTLFASIVGQLAGNHFLTIVEGVDQLRPLGEYVLWKGALDIVFARA